MQYNMMQYNMMQYNMMQYNMMQYNLMQYNIKFELKKNRSEEKSKKRGLNVGEKWLNEGKG